MYRKRIVSSGLLPRRLRFSLGVRRTLRHAAVGVAVLAGLLAAGPVGLSAPATPLPAEARLDFMSTDDGLTRDSIAAISRPEAARSTSVSSKDGAGGDAGNSAKTKRAAVVTHQRHRFLVATTNRRHHRWRHRQIARQHETATPPPASPQTRPHRNAVVKFVTWWNGMVIRNFHTRFGTVKLDSWGADT